MKKEKVIDWVNERISSISTDLIKDDFDKKDKEYVIECLEYLKFIKKELVKKED